jgi:hypothetical protein
MEPANIVPVYERGPAPPFWRVLGVTKSDAKERTAASAPSWAAPGRLVAIRQPVALASNVDGRRVMQLPAQEANGARLVCPPRLPFNNRALKPPCARAR